jgi:hypothetical protein
MKSEIEEALAALLGLPMWAVGRAGTLEWFQFGGPRLVRDRQGGSRQVGAYALHLDCAWRLVGADGMIWASDESETGHLSGLAGTGLECDAVSADETGGFRLSFRSGARLLVKPEERAEEYWRLLQPGRNTPHFVVGAVGIEPRKA